MAIDIVLMLKGIDTGAIPMLNRVTAAGKAVESQMAKLGVSPGLNALEQKAKRFSDAMDVAKQKTENLNNVLGQARNWGAGIAVAGGAALLLSHHLADVYREGARADEKLSSMLSKRGEGGAFESMAKWAGELAHNAALVDDDPIKEAAAGLLGFGVNSEQIKQIMPGLIGQSRLYGQSLDAVAMAFGKAFASGNAGALKRTGVTISQADIDHINAASTEVEKQQRLFEAVKVSMDRYALSITEGMSEAEIAANRLALELDNTQTAIGKGSANAEKSMALLGARILSVVGFNPGLAEGAGLIFTYGAGALTAVGSIASFVASIGQAYIALINLGIARSANVALSGASATAAGAEAAAITASGVAATGASVGFWSLAAAVAVVLAEMAAVAAIAAAVIYAIDRIAHFREDKRLSANIAAGDVASEELLKIENEKRAKKGLAPLSMEQFQGDANADDSNDMSGALAGLKKVQSGTPPVVTMPNISAAATSATMPVSAAPSMPSTTGTQGKGYTVASDGTITINQDVLDNDEEETVVRQLESIYGPFPQDAKDRLYVGGSYNPKGKKGGGKSGGSIFDMFNKSTDTANSIRGGGGSGGDMTVDLNIDGKVLKDASGRLILRLNAKDIVFPLSDFQRGMTAYE